MRVVRVTRFTTALSNLTLVLSSMWAVRSLQSFYYYRYSWAYGSFGTCLVAAALGVLRYGNPEYGPKLRTIHEFCARVSALVGCPLFVAELYAYYGFHFLCMIHVLCAAIPVMKMFMKRSERVHQWDQVIVAGCVASLMVLSGMRDNYYGMTSSLCIAFNYFGLEPLKERFELPVEDLQGYELCFCNYFFVRALTD